MAESLTVQMAKILNDYDEQVQNVTNAAIKRVARQTSQRIKNSSPKRPGGGSYAAGWSVKNIGGHGKIVDLVVHNRTDYQLTHLLENGHVIRNKKGTYGRAPAHPHIKPAETWANNELPAEIERKL